MNKLHKNTPIQDNTDCATGVSTSKTKRQANPTPDCEGIGNVSYMPRVNTPTNHSNKPLDDVIGRIRSPKYEPVTQSLRDLREKSEKAYKKQKAIVCEAVSFNGTFKLGQPVKNGTFEKSSGLLIVDLDHLEDVHLAKSDLITKPNIVFCFISPSGDGLKLGVRVDASLINNDADFKQAYFQIESIWFCRNNYQKRRPPGIQA
ncbi:BT4734/BF3469 family protein [Bathymodiolus japonicus methanotrophic gill symbiont]|uniref:BT4734/BF3469 family protein n=1 Tax=Bathymodiolus japonicus methanotrophic gill symbiont TaxID=113269 RepID=UPI001C8E7506|nr:BT4734/BF3469 family protein [Bathymodiolus japonicus methanotrophic gill symbiont]